MKLCPECDPVVPAVCDFCRYYDFNADDQGRYTGDGYCRFHHQPMDPGDGCENFHCHKLADGD